MRLFLDSCEPDEIREIAELGEALGGVTMNPAMVSKINRDYIANMKDICSIVGDIPVLAQVVSSRAEDILEEGKALSSIDDKIVVKVQMGFEGVKGLQLLKDAGVKTCATAIHSVIEAMLAAKTGTDYAALFVGPVAEVESDAAERLISRTRGIFDSHKIQTRIIGCSRNVNDVVESFACGADATTTVYDNWMEFFRNSLTLRRWDAFSGAWKSVYGERNWITGY